MLQKIKNFILAHKIIVLIVVILVGVGLYFIVKNNSSKTVSYVTEMVKKGNITTTVTGTGQVEASDTITLKAKTSGDIVYVPVKAGDTVKKGALIASVDSRDAKIALENAKISLEKLKSSSSLDLLKGGNSLKESYDSGWNKVSSYITDTTKLLDSMNDIYNSNSGYLGYNNSVNSSSSGKEKIYLGENSYYKAKDSLNSLIKIYKTLSRSDPNEKIKDLINKSYESSILVSTAVKNTEEAFNYMSDSLEDTSTSASSARVNITSWLSISNDYVNGLLSSLNAVNVNEKSFNDLNKGDDDLDLRSAQLSLQSKQNAYNDCFVYAPFDGVIATLTAKVGESSGSSIGTIITKQKVVTVSLNEIDISSISLGQKVFLTFDAINNLKINGDVVEIDSVGTVTSGVVNYNVKIALGEDDERVKAGMSANVEIITASKQNILTAPSGAVKTKSGVSYVEILGDTNKLNRREVTIGISDDVLTEIISGLNEGDKVVIKTVSSTASSSSAKNTKSMMGGGGGSAMGGVMH